MEQFDVIIKMPLPSNMKNANIINKTGKEKFEGAITIYDALCIGWNLDSNNKIKVDLNAEMPNYRIIHKADN